MANLFAFRSTDPAGLNATPDPVGSDNERWLLELQNRAELTVAAWEIHAVLSGRNSDVQALLQPMQCLGLSKAGHPRHPLYLRSNTLLEPYVAP